MLATGGARAVPKTVTERTRESLGIYRPAGVRQPRIGHDEPLGRERRGNAQPTVDGNRRTAPPASSYASQERGEHRVGKAQAWLREAPARGAAFEQTVGDQFGDVREDHLKAGAEASVEALLGKTTAEP